MPTDSGVVRSTTSHRRRYARPRDVTSSERSTSPLTANRTDTTGPSKAERRLYSQIANAVRWSNEPDRTAATAPARAAFEARFKNEADRRAYFLRLAAASALARRRRKASSDAKTVPRRHRSDPITVPSDHFHNSRSERARALDGLFAVFAENAERSAAQLDDLWGPVAPAQLRDILVIDGYRYFSGRLWQSLNAGLSHYLERRAA